jgi:hypothetical protein
MQSWPNSAQSDVRRLVGQKVVGGENPFFHSKLQKQIKTAKKILIVGNPPETLAAYQRR